MNILKIEGIGSINAAKLREHEILTTEALLETAGHAAGRRELAAKTGLAEHLLLDWVNRADLMRVNGVGEQYSDLLESAGVDTVKELSHRNADNLFEAMKAVNDEKHLVRRFPSRKDVHVWVGSAKELPVKVTY